MGFKIVGLKQEDVSPELKAKLKSIGFRWCNNDGRFESRKRVDLLKPWIKEQTGCEVEEY